MTRRRAWVVGLGLWMGCAVAPGGESAAPATSLTRSASFALAEPVVAPAITAAGAGVTVRWAGSLALPATSEGLGAVTATRAEAAGGVTLVHAGGVEERWTTTPTGAEQAWRYAARPAGDRVAVTVTLAGAALDHEADDGLWLRAATGELLRYGHATWVDADGRRTAVRSRWVDGRVAVEVPADVVAAAAYPAVLDPIVTPQFALQAPIENTLTCSTSYGGLVRTTAGSLYFNTLCVDPGVTTPAPLMVQRLDASNARVEGSFHPLVLGGAANFHAVASGGGAWVVWQDGARVVGLRVDATGNALDAAPRVLQADLALTDLACNATSCLLLGTHPGQVVVARFALDGTALDAAPVVVASPGTFGFGRQPVAALDDRFAVTWSQTPTGSTTDVFVARVGLDGAVQDPGGRMVTTAAANRTIPSLAANGSALLLTFQADASGARPAGTYALTLDRTLAPLGPIAVVQRSEAYFGAAFSFWDGAQWVVTDGVQLTRLAPDGTRRDDPLIEVTRDGIRAVLGADVGGFFELNQGAQRVASDGTLSGPAAPLSFSYFTQSLPAAGSDGTGFVAAWKTGVGEYVTRLSAAGVLRDAPLAVVAAGNGSYGFNRVTDLALEGTTAMMFGELGGTGPGEVVVDLVARTSGSPMNFQGGTGRSAVVRGNGQRLALDLGMNSGSPTATSLRRLSLTGAPLDAANIPMPTSWTIGGDFDGTRYLLAYSINVAGDVFVRHLDASGDFSEVSPRGLTSLGAAYSGLRLAFGGGGHLLTWVDASRQVRATRLGLDGAPLDATPLVLGSIGASANYYGAGADVSLSFNGRNFVAVWSNVEDRRLRAARVSPAGVLLDAAPLVLTDTQSRTSVAFSAASDANGSTLVVYDLPVQLLGTTTVRGLFLRDDGAVVPDGGVVAPTDVPTVDAGFDVPVVVDAGVDAPVVATDVPVSVDVPAAPDVPTSVDASTSDVVVATDASIDAGTPTDVVTATDAGTPTDRGASTDRGTPSTDVGAPTTDAGAPIPDAGTAPPDSGGLCSVQSVGTGTALNPLGSSALLLGAAALLRRRRRR